jgi:uncharacterized protein YifE (UPF0438 family)
MRAPQDHRELLKRRDFVLGCDAPNFTSADRDLLMRYGHWLTGLSTGQIQPITPEQEHFVQVAHEEAEPETDFEDAWVKLMERRKFEAADRAAPHFEVSDASESWISRSESLRNKGNLR